MTAPGGAIDPTQALNARAALRAELAGRAAPSLRPATLVGHDPLRPLPGAVLARVEVRQRAGFDPIGADHPRRDPWSQLEYLAFAVAGIGIILLIIGLISGHSGLTEIAAIVLAVGLIGGIGSRVWVQSDPLRVRSDERRVVTAAASWESRQPWTGALTAGPERALVGVAVDLAGQIASSPAWRSGYLDGHRMMLDLGAELDAVDAQAFQIAQARAGGGAQADVDAAFDGLLDRVLALRRYADGLTALGARITSANAELGAAGAIGQLRGGVDQGQYSIGDLGRLTYELGVIGASVDSTVAQVRSDRANRG